MVGGFDKQHFVIINNSILGKQTNTFEFTNLPIDLISLRKPNKNKQKKKTTKNLSEYFNIFIPPPAGISFFFFFFLNKTRLRFVILFVFPVFFSLSLSPCVVFIINVRDDGER